MAKKKNRKPANERAKASDPIRLAHRQLDEWIRGEIVTNPGAPFYSDQVSPDGRGVIWLGKLQQTMVQARNYYSHHSEPTPEPRTSPAAADTPKMQNKRGEWVPSIPLPFYGLKKRCGCGATFWRESNYNAHYALEHIVTGVKPL